MQTRMISTAAHFNEGSLLPTSYYLPRTTKAYNKLSSIVSHQGRNALAASLWPRICLLRSPAKAAILSCCCYTVTILSNECWSKHKKIALDKGIWTHCHNSQRDLYSQKLCSTLTMETILGSSETDSCVYLACTTCKWLQPIFFFSKIGIWGSWYHECLLSFISPYQARW